MKRAFIFFLVLILVLICCSCTQNTTTTSDKLQIVATLFPQYDFAREIAGEKAEVMLLAPAGADGHAYEPTPAEIIKISNSDMFIYTGKYMEAWADKIINSVDTGNIKVLDVSDNIELKIQASEHHHAETLFDPHIWTDPNNAQIMVDNITKALCDIDGDNADYYTNRAENYKQKLNELDKQFADVTAASKTKTMIFGDSFSFLYFAERYGIKHEAAFDSCSSEAEPSASVIAHIINHIKSNNIPVVYYSETSNKKVPESIAKETGAEALLFHSCHTVTKNDIENGVNYLTLMYRNLENLKRGIN